MLGWEFPPIINGGLGIACLGLGRAMAKHVDLTFILPQTDPDYLVDRVNLVGLNHLTEQDLESMSQTEEFRSFSEVELINADLQPYLDAAPETSEHVLTESVTTTK